MLIYLKTFSFFLNPGSISLHADCESDSVHR